MAVLVPMMASPGATPGLRLFELRGDGYAPALRSGDFLLVASVGGPIHDGDYLLDFGDGETPYRATRIFGRGVRIGHPNPRYSTWDIPVDEFERAVTGHVVAEVRVRDRTAIQGAYREHQQVMA